jgi:TRAP-type mannitol/chloroaromatic compound transport system permease small subunit
MIAGIYLGLARCEEHREHVRLELFLQRLKSRPRKIVEQVVYLVELATVGVMLYAVVLDAIVSFRTNEAVAGTVQMPIWPVKFIMVIGLFFYLVQILFKNTDNLKRLKKAEHNLL